MKMAEEDHVLGIGEHPIRVRQVDALIREEVAAGHKVILDTLDIEDGEFRLQQVADDVLLRDCQP